MLQLMTGHRGDVGALLQGLYTAKGHQVLPFDQNRDVPADRILHLAAKSPPATIAEIIASNIVYLHEVVNFSQRNRIKDFIFFSAVSVYGAQNKENVCENDCSIEPNLYAASKLFGERVLSESPLQSLSMRLPAVLGVRNRTNFLSRCYLKLKNNQQIELTNPDRLFNNFICVESIFEFLLNLNVKKKFEVVNLASRKEMTIREIVELMKTILHSRSEILLSDRKDAFFNISTQKAEKEYDFKPHDAEKTITRWVRQRQEYERTAGSAKE